MHAAPALSHDVDFRNKNSILNLWEDGFGDCVDNIFLSRFDNGAPEKTKPIKEEDYQTMVLARLTHDIHIISTL